MRITISGLPGSGKSTLADNLASQLKLKRYSVGDFRREAAIKKGLTLEEYNHLGEKDPSTDKDADEWQINLGKQDNFIIDGRLSWYFTPDSVKIFLTVDEKIGAKRIMLENREEELASSEEEAAEKIRERIKSDIKRYKKYYKLNPYDKKNYDFVLDTSKLTIKETTERVLKFLKHDKAQFHKL